MHGHHGSPIDYTCLIRLDKQVGDISHAGLVYATRRTPKTPNGLVIFGWIVLRAILTPDMVVLSLPGLLFIKDPANIVVGFDLSVFWIRINVVIIIQAIFSSILGCYSSCIQHICVNPRLYELMGNLIKLALRKKSIQNEMCSTQVYVTCVYQVNLPVYGPLLHLPIYTF